MIGSEKRVLKFGISKDEHSMMPGPGNYDQSGASMGTTNNKTYTFGAKSKDVYNRNPGPGAYDANANKVKDSSRTYVMSTEKRVLKFGNSKDEHSIPGPGKYN